MNVPRHRSLMTVASYESELLKRINQALIADGLPIVVWRLKWSEIQR